MGRSEAGRVESSNTGRLGLKANNPIIILEGPDGSGKTTLAKSIGGHYLHATHRFKGRMVLYHLALFKKAVELSQTDIVVIDRWRLSELVYGSVFRNGEEEPDMTEAMFALAGTQAVTHVMCLPEERGRYLFEFERLRRTREEKYEAMQAVYDKYAEMQLRFSQRRYDRFNAPLNEANQIVTGAHYWFKKLGAMEINCGRY